MKKKYFIQTIILFVLGALIVIVLVSWNRGKSILLESPDTNYAFRLNFTGDLTYELKWKDQVIIRESDLGFQLADGRLVPSKIKIAKITRNNHNVVWTPVYGERSSHKDNCNEVLVEFDYLRNARNSFAIRIRAYDEGIAFRYEFDHPEELEVGSELTEFSFVTEPEVWVSNEAQDKILRKNLSEISFACERPLLTQVSDSMFIAIGEAGLIDFAGMKLMTKTIDKTTLQVHLEKGSAASENGKINHRVFVPADHFNSPWRFIMAGKSPATILGNNDLILNLNEANKIHSTNWIKPGKVIREVTLTTQGGLACVDFAIKHNMQFVLFDAGWYGNEYDETSDATTVTVDPRRSQGPLDLHKVIKYADDRNIGIILYVNRRALESDLDKVLSAIKSWGVVGVKFGFVNVGPQEWTSWLHHAVRKAAEYELMVNIHDEYRPTGYSRTYPNLITQEGIRGDEESTSNDLVINTIFTRMIAGAGDQTNCYFAERVEEKMGSHASQMAKTICIYSPWQFLYWYDRPHGSPIKIDGAGGSNRSIPEIPDLTFFDDIPTIWDDTKVIDGYPGEFAVIARKNSENWYLGALTGIKSKNLSVSLDFLDKNRDYQATIYSDKQTGSKNFAKVNIKNRLVNSETLLTHAMQKQNGLAVVFTPL